MKQIFLQAKLEKSAAISPFLMENIIGAESPAYYKPAGQKIVFCILSFIINRFSQVIRKINNHFFGHIIHTLKMAQRAFF